MTKKPEELLREEVAREIEKLSKLEPGSTEHSATVKSVVDLYKLKIEDDKVAVDKLDKEEKRKLEAVKQEAEREEKSERLKLDNKRYMDERLDKIERRNMEKARNDIDKYDKQQSHELDAKRYETDKEHWQREYLLKVEQASDRSKDRIFDVCIKSAEIIVPIMFYSIWMRKGLKFEETGTFTSQTFKGLINRFRPNNK